MSEWLIDVLRDADSAPSAVVPPTAFRQQSLVQRRKTKAVEPFIDEGSTAYGSERISTAYGLSGDELEAWDAKAEFAGRVCVLAGLRFEQELAQPLVIDDVTLTVELWLDGRGFHVLLVRAGWPHTPARQSLSLAEVFAAVTTREVRQRKGPELARYKRRALVETEMIGPAAVSLRPLPERALRRSRDVGTDCEPAQHRPADGAGG